MNKRVYACVWLAAILTSSMSLIHIMPFNKAQMVDGKIFPLIKHTNITHLAPNWLKTWKTLFHHVMVCANVCGCGAVRCGAVRGMVPNRMACARLWLRRMLSRTKTQTVEMWWNGRETEWCPFRASRVPHNTKRPDRIIVSPVSTIIINIQHKANNKGQRSGSCLAKWTHDGR